MRRWTLTLFLMIAAGVAIAFAPRLLAAVGVVDALPQDPPQDPPVSGLYEVEAVDIEVHVQEAPPVVKAPVPPPAIPEVVDMPYAPPGARPPQPRPSKREATRAVDPGLWIPELDEQPHVDWTDVPPPPVPAPSFRDDGHGGGMG